MAQTLSGSVQFEAAIDVSAYRAALVRYFRRRTHPADVEDLAQDVLVSLQARRSCARIENIEAYVYTVAMRALAHRRRRDPPGRFMPLNEDHASQATEEISPERVLLGRERLAVSVKILEALPPRTQQIFLLNRFEGMTYAAIAEALGISTSAVEKHIMNALKALLTEERPRVTDPVSPVRR